MNDTGTSIISLAPTPKGDLVFLVKVFHSKIVPIVTYDLAIHSPQDRTMESVRIRTAEDPGEGGLLS